MSVLASPSWGSRPLRLPLRGWWKPKSGSRARPASPDPACPTGALQFAPGTEVGRVDGRGAAGSARTLGCRQRSGLLCCYDLFVLRAAAFAAPRPPEKPVLPTGTAMKVLLLPYKPGRETRHKPSFHVSAPKPQHAALLAAPGQPPSSASPPPPTAPHGRAAGPGSPTPNTRGKPPLLFRKSCKALPRAGTTGARSLCSQISEECGVLGRERKVFISF